MTFKAIAGSFGLIVGIVGSLLLLCRQNMHDHAARQAQWLRSGTEVGRAIASEPPSGGQPDGHVGDESRKIPDGYIPR